MGTITIVQIEILLVAIGILLALRTCNSSELAIFFSIAYDDLFPKIMIF